MIVKLWREKKITIFAVVSSCCHHSICMYETTNGVVLSVIKYNDRRNIVHIYTDNHGIMSFLVPQGKTAAARMRNAMFMPLSLLHFEAHMVPGRDLSTLHDVHRTHVLSHLYTNPFKNAIALFISELLSHTIQEREQNSGLFRYIATSIRLLDGMHEGLANFHICFLFHLGAFLGIEPDLESYRENYWFDMNEGVFTSHPRAGSHNLNPEEAKVIVLLSRMSFSNLHLFRFNRLDRNRMLDLMISYYRLHNSTIGTLKSPAILMQLFT